MVKMPKPILSTFWKFLSYPNECILHLILPKKVRITEIGYFFLVRGKIDLDLQDILCPMVISIYFPCLKNRTFIVLCARVSSVLFVCFFKDPDIKKAFLFFIPHISFINVFPWSLKCNFKSSKKSTFLHAIKVCGS